MSGKKKKRTSPDSRVPWIPLAGTFAVLVFLLLAFFATRKNRINHSTDSGTGGHDPSVSGSPESLQRPELVKRTEVDEFQEPDDPVHQMHGTVEGLKRLKSMYEQANRYPVTTLRLTADMTDVLNPNRFTPVTPLFIRKSELDSGIPDEPENRLYYRFWTDRFATHGNESMTLRFSAWQGTEKRKPAPVQIHSLESFAVTATGEEPLGKLPFSLITPGNIDEGQYQYAFQPGTLKKVQNHGYIKYLLSWQFPGEEPVRSEVVVHHTHQVPARYTGEFGEIVLQGNLVLKVGLEVFLPGSFNLSLLLFDESGKNPVAYVNQVKRLEPGKQMVEFVYYGLVFHDAGMAGPYTVTSARGYLQDDSTTGRGPEIPTWSGSWQTGPHELEDFTSDEFTSLQKESVLRAYDQQIHELEQKQGSPP